MISRLFGPRISVEVTVLGFVGDRMIRYSGAVRLRGAATVERVLAVAGRQAGADLLGALERGAQPSLLLDGRRLEIPAGLTEPAPDGARLAWLMPLAGG